MVGVMGQKQQLPTLRLGPIDATSLLAQDELDTKNGLPFRFGVQRPVSIDLLTESAKSKNNGYQVYEYQIESAGAHSLNLIFDQLHLKSGARLFLYNGERSMVIGPITDAQNSTNGDYWTDLLQGSSLILELQEPVVGGGGSQVHLSTVVHGYKDALKAFGDAGTCHPNMACYPDYQFQGDGVAMILLAGGTRLCTGFMVNTMRQTFRSFFQSAFHCLDLNNNNAADPGEVSDVQNWLVRFNYQSESCTPSQEDLDVVTLNGNTYRAGYAATDVLLVELNQQVPVDVNTTYNGWNRGEGTTSNNFGIHHPRGDVKKISFTNADTQPSGYRGSSEPNHLISFWGSLGVTDPGSSGSPLFDGNRRVVGQLHGGPSYCGATGSSLRDYYGRFFTSWTGGNTNDTRLSNWLDPDNGSGLTTDGVKPTITGPATLTGSGAFALNTRNSSVVSWAVTGPTGAVLPTSGVGNTANLNVLSTTSSLTITFQISDGQPYPIVFSRVFNTVQTAPTSNALTLLPPTYTCATGAIRFNTSGGDGTPITYSVIGVQRASTASNSGTVEAGLRADPKPITITAMQSGISTTTNFDFGAFCAHSETNTNPPPPSTTATTPSTGSSLALLPPTYNCVTGAITFNTTGGNGTPIIYSAVGVQRASAISNTGVVEAGLRSDPKPLFITATQGGVTVSLTFDFAASCLTTNSGTSTSPPSNTTIQPTGGGPLILLTPSYNCQTGAITFNTSGGNGSKITYSAVGVQRPSVTSNTGIVEAGLRGDPKPLFITATQNGATTSITFNFAAFCAGARVATNESQSGLTVEVLGNPTATEQATIRVWGAEGQPLTVRAMDASGNVYAQQVIERAGTAEVLSVRLGRSAGVYVVQVQSGEQRQSLRVVRIE